MKIIITILLTVIAVMALLIGATIVLDSRGDAEAPANISDEDEDAVTPTSASPVSTSGVDFVSFTVSYAEEKLSSLQTMGTEEALPEEDNILDYIINGEVNFEISFNGVTDYPFVFNNPIPDHTINGETYSVATFVFSSDNNSTYPFITFFPRYMNSVQNESAHSLATFFVNFNDIGSDSGQVLYTLPIPDNTMGFDSFAVTFIITFEDTYYSINQLMADNLLAVGSGTEALVQSSSGGSISVEDAANIMASLASTWVYRAPGVHVEMTFMNDWRYYEIQYAPSGRPTSWESGVYSINCGRTLTIQSGSIWGPTYIYNFKLRNNGLTLSYNGVNYIYTRQNRLPILSLENFPYAQTSGRIEYPYSIIN